MAVQWVYNAMSRPILGAVYHILISYSLMQSDRNSYCGDIFYDESVIIAFRDEENILDQIYENQT